MTKKLEPWRKVLLDAADLLERDGWCQHHFRNEKGHRCVIEAIGAATDHKPLLRDKARYQLAQALPGSLSIIEWNDAHSRRKSQVIKKLREVARGLTV
jgi:hypothetical protein